MLQSDYFDVTVINGTEKIETPVDTIKEALRMTASDGMIICLSNEQYLLDDTFRLMFSERHQWRFSPGVVIFKADKKSGWV